MVMRCLKFGMVMRFLCGLSSEGSINVFYLLYKHVTPRPGSIGHLPECVQLKFEGYDLFECTGWEGFTEKLLQLSAMLCESNSIPFQSISTYADISFLAQSAYILSTVTPNEWICFLESILKPLERHVYSLEYVQ